MKRFMVTLRDFDTFEVAADTVTFLPNGVVFRMEVKTGRWPWDVEWRLVCAFQDWAEVREIR